MESVSKNEFIFVFDSSALLHLSTLNLHPKVVETLEDVIAKFAENGSIFIPQEVRDQLKIRLLKYKEAQQLSSFGNKLLDFLLPKFKVRKPLQECEKIVTCTVSKLDILEDFQKKLEAGDKECIFLSLELSRTKKDKIVFLVTDDWDIKNVGNKIFQTQFIGNIYFLHEFFCFTSSKSIMKMTKNDLLDVFTTIKSLVKKGEWIKEIESIIRSVNEFLCPYKCETKKCSTVV